MAIQDRGFERTSSGGTAVASPQRTLSGTARTAPTHEQISARAKAIWEAKGRPVGRDEENWREAEAQLRGAARKA